jgi:hypothetical protein
MLMPSLRRRERVSDVAVAMTVRLGTEAKAMARMLLITTAVMAASISRAAFAQSTPAPSAPPMLSDVQLGLEAMGGMTTWKSHADIVNAQTQIGQTFTDSAQQKNPMGPPDTWQGQVNLGTLQSTFQGALPASMQGAMPGSATQSAPTGMVQGAINTLTQAFSAPH